MTPPPLNQVIVTIGGEMGSPKREYKIYEQNEQDVYEGLKKLDRMKRNGEITVEQYRERKERLGREFGERI
jgi:hypothetical protein